MNLNDRRRMVWRVRAMVREAVEERIEDIAVEIVEALLVDGELPDTNDQVTVGWNIELEVWRDDIMQNL